MSDADLELVRGLQPSPEADLAVLFNDPSTWAVIAEARAHLFTPEFECAGIGGPQGEVKGIGFDGLRAVWHEWLTPWQSYRTTVEDVVGNADKVMVLVHDRGIARQGGVEVELRAASVWTMRDGRIARVEFYTDRDLARRAAGF